MAQFDWTVLIPVGSALIGTLVGGGVSYYAQARTRQAELAERRRSLAHALAAEIEVLQRIVARRDLPGRCQAAANSARAGDESAVREWLSEQDGRTGILPIYHANLANIGLLEPACVNLVTYVGQVEAILATIRGIHDGLYDRMDGERIADLIEGELELWRVSEKLAEKVVKELKGVR